MSYRKPFKTHFRGSTVTYLKTYDNTSEDNNDFKKMKSNKLDNADDPTRRSKNISFSANNYDYMFGEFGIKKILETISLFEFNKKLKLSDSDFLIEQVLSRFNSDEPIIRIENIELSGSDLTNLKSDLKDQYWDIVRSISKAVRKYYNRVNFITDVFIEMRKVLITKFSFTHTCGQEFDESSLKDTLEWSTWVLYKESFKTLIFDQAQMEDSFNRFFFSENLFLYPGDYNCTLPPLNADQSDHKVSLVIEAFMDIFYEGYEHLDLDQGLEDEDDIEFDFDDFLYDLDESSVDQSLTSHDIDSIIDGSYIDIDLSLDPRDTNKIRRPIITSRVIDLLKKLDAN